MFWIAQLENWFNINQRPLPWRTNPNPYFIWLSEVMSQQTTMAAILPYFKRFTDRFPNLETLAKAEVTEVLQEWAGLGYPARARNLHQTAQWIFKHGFPQTYPQWLEQKGVGPYTAAAISSIAFNERVGVVDGNVIRVLSRFLNTPFEHWKLADKKQLQTFMNDSIQRAHSPSQFNQAMMELGALVCTKINPKCLLCPIRSDCQGWKFNTIDHLPLAKPNKKIELWLMAIDLFENQQTFATQLMPQNAPFLKGYPFFIHSRQKIEQAPNQYHFIHQITHHKIYVTINRIFTYSEPLPVQWLTHDELKKSSPFSIIDKVLQQGV